ncbi:putative lipoprotein [Synechococcus sp. BIOS-U3-1]|nr:putative lipoprotein [Synechococcus sp. BIOS-U3-1]
MSTLIGLGRCSFVVLASSCSGKNHNDCTSSLSGRSSTTPHGHSRND